MARTQTKNHKLQKSSGDGPELSPKFRESISRLSPRRRIQLASLLRQMEDQTPSDSEKDIQASTSGPSLPMFRTLPKDSKGVKAPPLRVSIAGIFKKTKNQTHKRDRNITKVKSQDSLLVTGVQGMNLIPPYCTVAKCSHVEGLEIAYEALRSNSKSSFDTVRDKLRGRLAVTKTDDKAFIARISAAADSLSAPLVDEEIEIQTLKHGQRIKETVRIGTRVSNFKKVVEKENARLTDLWKQWEEIQNDYLELGVDVFGAGRFAENAAADKHIKEGFKKELEQIVKEHDVELKKIYHEVEGMRTKMLQKMVSSEKVRIHTASLLVAF